MSITESNSIAIAMSIFLSFFLSKITVNQISDYFMNSVTLFHILKGNYELTGLPSNPIGPWNTEERDE